MAIWVYIDRESYSINASGDVTRLEGYLWFAWLWPIFLVTIGPIAAVYFGLVAIAQWGYNRHERTKDEIKKL